MLYEKLMRIYRDEQHRIVLKTWKQEEFRRKCAKRRALRRVIRVLMNIYADEAGWTALIERQHKGSKGRKPAPRATPITIWVDEVHGDDTYKGEKLKKRVMHAITMLRAYVMLVMRPDAQRQLEEKERSKNKQRARWNICAYLVRVYKNDKQQGILEDRAEARSGLICAHTRNVGRLKPKGGVVYDETRRNKTRIRVDEVYNTHRWPRRDKCGPTLARLLHHIWGIT